MRNYLLATAAAATVAIAAPAAATTDNAGYVGLEGGVLFPKSQSVTGTINFTTTGTPGPVNFGPSSVANVKYKTGYDIDVDTMVRKHPELVANGTELSLSRIRPADRARQWLMRWAIDPAQATIWPSSKSGVNT